MNNLEIFFQKFEKLPEIIQKLNANSIQWMIGGSGCLFLLGNNREPDDVDIFLPKESHNFVDEFFKLKSFSYSSPVEEVRNSNPFGSHSYQLTSNLHFKMNGKVIDFMIDENVLNHRKKVSYKSLDLFLLPPEDVLLIKAILQRGTDVGKHDIEDINKFIKIYSEIDYAYLKNRINQIDVSERVNHIFNF